MMDTLITFFLLGGIFRQSKYIYVGKQSPNELFFYLSTICKLMVRNYECLYCIDISLL